MNTESEADADMSLDIDVSFYASMDTDADADSDDDDTDDALEDLDSIPECSIDADSMLSAVQNAQTKAAALMGNSRCVSYHFRVYCHRKPFYAVTLPSSPA